MTAPSRSLIPPGERHLLGGVFRLVVTALGLTLLALGLRQWVVVAWGNDSTASRSPVPYGTRVELPSEASALPAEARWIVLVAGRSTADVCERLAQAVAPVASVATVAIVAWDGRVTTAVACWPAAGRSRAREVSMINRRLGSIPSDGFIVTDRTGRVLYGSYAPEDLAHALPSLALLD